jgi:hypothetical protein
MWFVNRGKIPMKLNKRNAAAIARYANLVGLTPQKFLNKFLEDFLLAQFEDLFSGTAESYLSDFSFKNRLKAQELAAWIEDRFKRNDPKAKFEIEVNESPEGKFRVSAASFSHGQMYQV